MNASQWISRTYINPLSKTAKSSSQRVIWPRQIIITGQKCSRYETDGWSLPRLTLGSQMCGCIMSPSIIFLVRELLIYANPMMSVESRPASPRATIRIWWYPQREKKCVNRATNNKSKHRWKDKDAYYPSVPILKKCRRLFNLL